MTYLAYLWYVLRHKWWVFYYAWSTGASLRLAILHDLSKFSRAEFGPYARWFYGPDGQRNRLDDNPRHTKVWYDFDDAWRHHKGRNKHHPEYWYQDENSYGEIVPLEIPDQYIGEMIADWLGAGRAITGHNNLQEWWDKSKSRFLFHPLTRVKLEHQLWMIGINTHNNQGET